jgi:hypothetical protein
MKKQIIVLIIASLMLIASCGFTRANTGVETTCEHEPVIEYVDRVVEKIVEVEVEVEVDTCFRVEQINQFTDANLFNYTLEELETLIKDAEARQEQARRLATSARKLGWPEDSPAITSAEAEWHNAKAEIEVYSVQYQKLYDTLEKARWDAKMEEFPAATTIWLYMKDLGWNDYVCAGIMGNLMAEVGGQTLNIQYWLYGKKYYGMCQWSKEYYSEIWGADLATQCDFLRDTIKYEIDTFGYAYKKGFNLNSFLAMTNEKDAALAFAKCYERCSSKHYNVRQTNAEKAYNYFVNN